MNREEWNKNAGHPMQSWEWGKFREKMGNRITRINGDNQYLIIWTNAKPTNLWFGYCPMSKIPTEEDLKTMKDGIGIRFEPYEMKGAKVPDGLTEGRHLFKPKTYWIDLTLDEDELLGRMTSKCR